MRIIFKEGIETKKGLPSAEVEHRPSYSGQFFSEGCHIILSRYGLTTSASLP